MGSTIPLAALLILSSALGLICSAEAYNFLHSGRPLNEGQSISQGPDHLHMRSDCNLVLYRAGTRIWESNTAGAGTGCRCELRDNGSLAVLTSANSVIWSTRPSGRPRGNHVMLLQPDGNLVIYGPGVWDAGTNFVKVNGDRIAAIVPDSTAASEVNVMVAK